MRRDLDGKPFANSIATVDFAISGRDHITVRMHRAEPDLVASVSRYVSQTAAKIDSMLSIS